MSPEVARFVRELEAAGWKRRPGRKHVKLLSPGGAVMVVSSTPSDRRALTNMRSLARRLGKA